MGKKSIRTQRKEEIIKAFYAVAKKEGLENASIAKVAARARVTPGLVMFYFKTRDELMLALNEFILERYLRIYQVSGPTINSMEKLSRLIENLFSRKWNRLFDDGVFYSCYAQIYRNHIFRKNFKELHDLLHKKLKKALDEAREHQLLDAELDTAETAEHLFALVDGAYYYLGMVENSDEMEQRLVSYKKLAFSLLKLPLPEQIRIS